MKKKFDEETLLEHASIRFNNSSNWRQTNIEQSWQDENDAYDSQFTSRERKNSDVLLGQGRLFIPKTYSHTQRILVDVMDSIFFDSEELLDVTSWKNLPAETREMVKTLLNYRLNGHPINFYYEALEAAQDALRNKVGIFKVWPEIVVDEVKEDKELVSEDGSISVKSEKKLVMKDFYPQIKCIPYEDVFFDSSATWKDYWKYTVIHRFKVSKDYAKRREWKNLDKVTESDDSTDAIKLQRQADQGSPFSPDKITDESGMFYAYEIWTHLDINNDGKLESCVYICGGDINGPTFLCKDVMENDLPYKVQGEDYNRPPIVVGTAFPESHKMYGKSLPSMVMGLQKETNALRNQRREAVAMALRSPLLVSRSAGIDLVSLVNRRIGAVVMGDDISESSARELRFTDPTQTSVQEQLRTDQDFYETTSVPPNLLGGSGGSDETATESIQRSQNANKKINFVIKNLVNTLFMPTFKMLLRLEQEYTTDEYIKLVTGRVLGWKWANDGIPAREYIQGEFDLTVNMGVNKQVQLNRMMLMMDRATMANGAMAQAMQAGIIQPGQGRLVDTMKFFERMMPLLGEKNIQEMFIQMQQPAATAPSSSPLGLASQPTPPSNLYAGVSNTNPEGEGMI